MTYQKLLDDRYQCAQETKVLSAKSSGTGNSRMKTMRQLNLGRSMVICLGCGWRRFYFSAFRIGPELIIAVTTEPLPKATKLLWGIQFVRSSTFPFAPQRIAC